MKTMLKCAGLGAALLAAASLPAQAADWHVGSGGAKDMRGAAAVPVPAPMPIPDYKSEWYFRVDAGIGLGGGGRDGSESGMAWGTTNGPPALPGDLFGAARGSQSSWFNDDFDTFITYGGGVGRYWSDRFRTDLTLEALSDGEVTIEGVDRYDRYVNNVATYDPVVGSQVNVYVSDVTKVDTVVAMLNAYYDFGKLHGFTPYVGGGLGVAVHYLNRRHAASETTCDDTVTDGTCDFGTETVGATATQRSKQTDFSLAAALTAGLSYQLSEITLLDFNYRYLYVGGTEISMAVTDAGGNASRSTVSVGEISEHQLRAGLRFNIN